MGLTERITSESGLVGCVLVALLYRQTLWYDCLTILSK